MQVNLQAVSDALDGLLAEKKINNLAPRQWKNLAIIQKRQPPPSQPTASDRHADVKLQTAKTGSGAEMANLACTEDEVDTELIHIPTDLTMIVDQKGNGSPDPSLGENRGAGAAINSTALKKKSPSQRSSRTQKLETRIKESGSSSEDRSNVYKFFAHLMSADIIATRPVGMSGIGVGSILVTPRNIARRIEKGELPSKSWVTNTALTPSACAILEVENFDQLQQKHCHNLPLHSDTKDHQSNAHSVMCRDAKLVVYVEDNTEHFRHVSDTHNQSPSETLSLSVTVDTSNSLRGGFMKIVEELLPPNNVAAFTVPGTQLSQFIRVTIMPSGQQGAASKLIRVRALCVYWSNTWTSKLVEHLQPSNLLDEEVMAFLREGSKKLERASSTERLTDLQNTTPRQQFAPREAGAPAEEKKQALSWNSSRKPDFMNFCDISGVADFVKDAALSTLHSDPVSSREKNNDRVHSTWEYNWLSDEVDPCLPEKSLLPQTRRAKKTDCKGSEAAPSGGSALSEYILTLQAWNSAPLWGVEEAIEFCLSQTTSFSVSTILVADLFSESAAFHFTQPFKVHFLITTSPTTGEESNNVAVPSGATPPPLHSLSSVASQVAALGYTSELLFKTDACGSFGCVIRPESAVFNSVEDRYKLLFVIPADAHSSYMTEAVDVAIFMLKTALSIFKKPERAQLKSVKRFPGRFSPLVLSERQSRFPYGALKLLVDGTECFEKLTSILTEWSDFAGPIRYYGDAAQPMLRMLLAPFRFAGLENSASCESEQEDYNTEVQWARLHIKMVGLWKSDFGAWKDSAKSTVALEVAARISTTYVWQSTSRVSTPLRLLLTDNHLLETAHDVDGLILPLRVTDLVQKHASMPPVALLSETPWLELLQSAEKLINTSSTASIAATRDSFASFAALRRRVTISFSFHILSTAFKRGWERVSVSMPELYARFQALAAEWSNSGAVTAGLTTSVDCCSCTSLSFLDEDAFMDTFVQWRYPFPEVVILHCTSVFGAAAPLLAYLGAEIPLTNSSCRSSSGATSLFSREALCRFSSVPSLEAGLT